MTIQIYPDLEQGSEEWHAARCGLITASEVKLILTMEGGNTVTKYRPTQTPSPKPTPKKDAALSAIGGREGSIKDLSLIADVSDGLIRKLVEEGCVEAFSYEVPIRCKALDDDRTKSHVWELAAQRITKYTEPSFIGEAIERGWEDEEYARTTYEEHTGQTVTQTGFITNDAWGFTMGYSPDGLVGEDGLIECKSRRQKFQVQTIVEWARTGGIPSDFVMQCQSALLISGRKWLDFVSYSGGMKMPIIRVEPDPVIQEAIIAAATAFEIKVCAAVKEYQAASGGFPMTERRERHEGGFSLVETE